MFPHATGSAPVRLLSVEIQLHEVVSDCPIPPAVDPSSLLSVSHIQFYGG